MIVAIPKEHLKWCSSPYLVLPLKIGMSRRKTYYINLNTYRNASHIENSKAKSRYAALVIDMKHAPIPFKPPYVLMYRMFYNRNAQIDVSNFLSVLDKFVSDALVDIDIIPDDCATFVRRTIYDFAGIKDSPPHAHLHILPHSAISLEGFGSNL